MQLDPLGRQVLEFGHLATAGLAQVHESAGVLLGRDDRHPEVRLLDAVDALGGREVGRIVDHHHVATGGVHPVLHAGGGGEECQTELALEAFLHDLHVQQPQETASETETQRPRTLGLVGDRGIVQFQFLERLAQVLEIVAVDGVQTAEHHGLGIAIPRQGLGGRALRHRHGLTRARLADVFDAGDEIPHLAGPKFLHRGGNRSANADLDAVVERTCLHELQP